MAYFRCSAVGGGAEGDTVILTCDEQFAGSTITATKGSKTISKSCPSSSPYEIEFNGLTEGTWTFSGTYQGETRTFDYEIVYDQAMLAWGFNWRVWCILGGVNDQQYQNLEDVLDDEVAVRRLMIVHQSAQYLIDAVTNNVDVIDDFCANDTAMKWIGLSDFACDGLEAISGVVDKFLASTYWERYLKDHVPIMTNMAIPYGAVSGSATYSSTYPLYYCFDGNDSTFGAFTRATNGYVSYTFTAPTMVKKVYLKSNINNVKFFIQASNNESTWTTLSEPQYISTTSITEIDLDNVDYYRTYRVTNGSDTSASSSGYGFYVLQFFGRTFSVVNPHMTSNSAPYGTADVSSVYNNQSDFLAYKAFDISSGDCWISNSGANSWISFDYKRKVALKYIFYRNRVSGSSTSNIKNFKIQGYNDASSSWEDISSVINNPSNTDNIAIMRAIETNNLYAKFRLYVTETYSTYAAASMVMFCCRDYSEKEFESGATKMVLYDHGLDLATLDTTGTITIGDEKITLSSANAQGSKSVNLTNYNLLFAKVGDHMSGTTQLIASTTATINLDAGSSPNANALNVSSINQTLATGVKMTSAGTCDILELWLE